MSHPLLDPKVKDYLQDCSDRPPDLPPRDYIYFLDLDFDIDAQLAAIHDLLHQHGAADQQLTNDLKQLEEHARALSGAQCEAVVDEWVDRLHHGTYEQAARSMAAVGMLAPLLETIFYQSFLSIGRKFYAGAPPPGSHPRWLGGAANRWDCHFSVTAGRAQKDIVEGVKQLADATGLALRLPPDFSLNFAALIAYRNKMFHNGFEWPQAERVAFAARIQKEGWPPGWFHVATSGGDPWIYYLSTLFIDHCLQTVKAVLNAFGELVLELADARPVLAPPFTGAVS